MSYSLDSVMQTQSQNKVIHHMEHCFVFCHEILFLSKTTLSKAVVSMVHYIPVHCFTLKFNLHVFYDKYT